MSNVFLFLPELICLLAALLVFVMEMFRPANRVLWRLSMVGAIAVLGGALLTFGSSGEPFFPGVYKVDLFSQLVKAGLAFGLAVVVFLTRRTSMLTSWSRRELPLFLFCSTFGMMMMVSSTELLTFYLGLEFSAYPLFASFPSTARMSPDMTPPCGSCLNCCARLSLASSGSFQSTICSAAAITIWSLTSKTSKRPSLSSVTASRRCCRDYCSAAFKACRSTPRN